MSLPMTKFWSFDVPKLGNLKLHAPRLAVALVASQRWFGVECHLTILAFTCAVGALVYSQNYVSAWTYIAFLYCLRHTRDRSYPNSARREPRCRNRGRVSAPFFGPFSGRDFQFSGDGRIARFQCFKLQASKFCRIIPKPRTQISTA